MGDSIDCIKDIHVALSHYEISFGFPMPRTFSLLALILSGNVNASRLYLQ